MTSLLIVESPAKCSKIQGYLGPGWRVIATMGHIRALDESLDAVGLERDFEPRYQFLKDKGKAIAQIKEAAAKASTIYLASDDDREGEAISYSVAVLLKLNTSTTPRAVFHEITEAAVKEAVANPRRLDMNRVNAQQARAVLDMMVGFTISPLLWKYVGPALSAGRCQTPALRIVVEQEKAITDFATSTAWKIKGKWATKSLSFEANMVEDLEDQESAENYLENIHADTEGRVTEAATRPTTESPPKPLITSTLQQEASAAMGIQPKSAMRIAQRLYEAGHITYMRTDSAVLSEEARLAAEAWVRDAFGQEYLGAAVAAATTKKTVAKTTRKEGAAAEPQEAHESRNKSGSAAGPPAAQEAHEAIRPTHLDLRDLPAHEDWSTHDRKIYKLIWNRAVQSVMAPARGESRTIDFLAKADPMEFVWKAQWKRQLFAGWRRIGSAATNFDADEDAEQEKEAAEDAWAAAAALDVDSIVHWTQLETWPHTTKPPSRYTEATLVRELERRGIGRPSTFAALVGTLMDKNYAQKGDTPAKEVDILHLRLDACGQWPMTPFQEKKRIGGEKQKLVPTGLGRSVLEFCVREFGNLFEYAFTREMETRLDLIAEGTQPWKALCKDTWGSYKEKYESLKSGKGSVAQVTRERHFANGIKAIQSKKGPLLLKEGPTKDDSAVFYGWPEGRAFGEITEEEVAAFVAKKQEGGGDLGTYEGNPIVRKSGPYGAYASCGGVNVPLIPDDTEEKIQAKLAAKSQPAILHKLGPFEFRNGPYGVYFFKSDLTGKSRKFVSLPTGIDPKVLTQEAAVKLYQDGLKKKATAGAYKKKNT
jgi:DNA topoisomerase-1